MRRTAFVFGCGRRTRSRFSSAAILTAGATPVLWKTPDGVWEYTLAADRFGIGSRYKYRIRRGGRDIFKADPYGFFAECPPATASVYFDIEGFEWRDAAWLERRRAGGADFYARPMNIYEVHAGSWKRNPDGSYYSYRQLAEELIPYVQDMGYTHIELMPVAEHLSTGPGDIRSAAIMRLPRALAHRTILWRWSMRRIRRDSA